jgi:DNA repair protein SbcD/Mre11
MDYRALGHVHEKGILSTDLYVVYPGNSQGLSIRETGPRGCYIVSVDETRRPLLSFSPLDAIRWFSVVVDMAGIDSLDGLERAISLQFEEIADAADGRPVIARISLAGRTPLYAALRKEETVEALLDRARAAGFEKNPPLWIQELRIDCLPEIGLFLRRRMDDLVGQVLRDIDSLREKTRHESGEYELLPEVLTPALGELFHHWCLFRWLEPLTPADCERLFAEAERLCPDLLEPEP